MIKLTCECGSREFWVDSKKARIRCSKCGTEYVFEDSKWKKIERKKIKQRIIDFVQRTVEGISSWTLETTGQIRKRLGVQKIKIKKELKKRKLQIRAVIKKDKKEERIRKRWSWLIDKLFADGEVFVSANEHFGKLRGKDILAKAKSDLKRIGIKTTVRWHNDGGKIRLEV